MQLADMDGDGAADVLARISPASDGLRYYPATEGGFGAPVVIRPGPTGGFEDPDVRLVDLDHDKRTDWMRIDPTSGEVWVAFNEGEGAFTTATSMGRLDPAEVVSFSRSRLQLADANGDGLADLVLVRSGSARYWPAMGFGQFGQVVSLPGGPTLSDSELAALQVRDINGDGTADLVHVGVSRVRYWLNLAGIGLMAAMTVDGTPELRPTTVVRIADMNGNGTADIVWIDSTSSTPWRYLDVLPRGTPGLLERIDNGLGRVTTIEYAGMGEMRRWAREQSIEWTRRSPIGQTVLRRVSMDTGLDPTVVYELRYADGYFDGEHREFRGFGRALRFDLGDEEQPTLVTDMRFDVGDIDEALKGFSLESERRDETGGVFDRAVSTYTVRTVDMATSGEEVRYAYQSRQETFIFELGADATVLRSEWEHDDYGNVVREVEYGIVEGDDVRVGDDERVMVRAFATDTSRWILDRVTTERTETLGGERLAETRTYYDGEAFEGLPLGSLGRFAEASRVESWIDAERFALGLATSYDNNGNVAELRDGRGGRRQRLYDDAGVFVTGEHVYTSEGSWLSWSAGYDGSLGSTLTVVDANGHQSSASYDVLGRMTTVVLPGDSEEYPTRALSYTYGAPLSFIREEVRATAGTDDVLTVYRYIDATGRTRAEVREGDDGQWVVSGLVTHGARGLSRHVARPFFARSADFPLAALEEVTGTVSEYDALARVVLARDIDGSQTWTRYSPLTQAFFDENDTDEESPHYNTPTTVVRDGLDRLVAVMERDESRQVVTSYTFDPLGNLLSATDAAGHQRRYSYDGRSRRVRVEDPNAGVWTMEYDDGDSLVRRLDPESYEVRFQYDLAGRVLEEQRRRSPSEPFQSAVRHHYDAPASEHPELGNVVGQLAWVEDEAGVEYFGYDARARTTDRVRRWDDGTEHHAWTDFDSSGRVTRRGYPDGTHIELSYSSRGLVQSVGPIVTDIEWSARGDLELLALGNGATDRHTYDARQRLTRMEARSATGEVLRDLEYTRDGASRITEVADLRPGVAPALDQSALYAFDDRYRLTQQTSSTRIRSWDHDDVGNILWEQADGAREDRVYGEDGLGPDRLTHLAGELLTYDRAGRLVSDAERTLQWDARGRLSRVTRGDVVEEHVYSWDGRRVLRRDHGPEGDALVRYIDDDIEERDGRLVRYVDVSGRHVARLDASEPVRVARSEVPWPVAALGWLALLLFGVCLRSARGRQMLRHAGVLTIALVSLVSCVGGGGGPREASVAIDTLPPGAEFYLGDVRHSVTTLVGSDGQLVGEARLSAYGERESVDGTQAPQGFLGAEHDPSSGLVAMGARPYRAEAGVFLAPDPIAVLEPDTDISRPATLYPYAYSASDPVNQTDESGLLLDTLVDAAFITYDVGTLLHDIDSGADRETVTLDVVVLTVDVLCAFIPLATGGGEAVRGGHALYSSYRATQATTHQVQASVRSAEVSTRVAAREASVAAHEGTTAERAVRPGDTGTYGELTSRRRRHGESEPLDMDHQPSYAAQREAAERARGAKLSREEARQLKADTPAVASPRPVHQKTSPTYGGRNTRARVESDAADLGAAQRRDRAAFDEAMRSR